MSRHTESRKVCKFRSRNSKLGLTGEAAATATFLRTPKPNENKKAFDLHSIPENMQRVSKIGETQANLGVVIWNVVPKGLRNTVVEVRKVLGNLISNPFQGFFQVLSLQTALLAANC